METITETTPIAIERNNPVGLKVIDQVDLGRVDEMMEGKQDVVGLATYIRDVDGKPRGLQGGKIDLNSHFEEFIVREDNEIKVVNLSDLQEKLAAAGVAVEILGVESIGNANQRVSAVVQGVDRNNRTSGYERPTVAEGPHMILAPFAVDSNGQLHIFRTIQYRTGEAVVDTPRGFADSQSLKSGKQMYEVEGAGERVKANLTRVIGEEAGEKLLNIKRVVYLGAPRVNSSFVTSKSALFGVEVDYDAFVKSNKVLTDAEFARRREQLEHEGLMGVVLDVNVDQYVNYKRDSEINRDMAADAPSDIVVIDWLATKLDAARQVVSERQFTLKKFTEVFKKLKQSDPVTYKQAWSEVVEGLNIKS